jgi:hypothetical protein
MKKITIYLLSQKYEIEMEDRFLDYIREDIERINSSKSTKDLLNIILSSKYESYKNEKKMTKLLKKLEKF